MQLVHFVQFGGTGKRISDLPEFDFLKVRFMSTHPSYDKYDGFVRLNPLIIQPLTVFEGVLTSFGDKLIVDKNPTLLPIPASQFIVSGLDCYYPRGLGTFVLYFYKNDVL
jgi:hypothetical protein